MLSVGVSTRIPPGQTDKYVIAEQWDFDGDGSWDTEMVAQNPRYIKRVYDKPGTYAVRARAKMSDGEITDVCNNTFSLSSSTQSGPGDGNGDGKVDLIDLSVLLSDFNKTGAFRKGIDMNSDGIVNSIDFRLLRIILVQNGIIKNAVTGYPTPSYGTPTYLTPSGSYSYPTPF